MAHGSWCSPLVRAVTRVWQGIRAVPPLSIVVVGWLVFVQCAYPGLMSIDSFDQLGEARAWFFTDSHPPAMAAVWGVLDRIIHGPFLMLLLQSIAFAIGLYLVLRRALAERAAAVWSVVILLYPPVAAVMAVVWKDCQMAGFLMLGAGALLDDRRNVRVAGLFALFVATAMRYNAPAATLPLVVLLFEWRPTRTRIARYAIAVAAWIAITGAAFGVNALLTDREMHYWASSLGIEDIVGTLTFVDEDLPDSELGPLLAPTQIHIDHDYHREIRARYVTGEFGQIISGPHPLWTVPINGTTPAPESQRDAIAAAWRAIIPAHRAAYLRYRLDTFAECLGLRKSFRARMMTRGVQDKYLVAGYHLPTTMTWYQRAAEDAGMWMFRKTRLFRPHGYLFLALALLALCRRQRDVFALLLSGLFLELSLLPLVQTPDYRYSHWMVVCTCVAVVMLFARRRREVI
jgi:hypothetical protein